MAAVTDGTGLPCHLVDRYLSGVRRHLTSQGRVFGLYYRPTLHEEESAVDDPVFQGILAKFNYKPRVLQEGSLS